MAHERHRCWWTSIYNPGRLSRDPATALAGVDLAAQLAVRRHGEPRPLRPRRAKRQNNSTRDTLGPGNRERADAASRLAGHSGLATSVYRRVSGYGPARHHFSIMSAMTSRLEAAAFKDVMSRPKIVENVYR